MGGRDSIQKSVACRSAARSIAARLSSTSSSVVAHDETLMRMAVWPCQTVPPHQQVPSAWIAAITRLRGVGIAERHQHLVQHHVVQHLGSRPPRSPSAKRVRVPAAALDQVGQPAAAQRAQRRPDLDAARAPRKLGRVI